MNTWRWLDEQPVSSHNFIQSEQSHALNISNSKVTLLSNLKHDLLNSDTPLVWTGTRTSTRQTVVSLWTHKSYKNPPAAQGKKNEYFEEKKRKRLCNANTSDSLDWKSEEFWD